MAAKPEEAARARSGNSRRAKREAPRLEKGPHSCLPLRTAVSLTPGTVTLTLTSQTGYFFFLSIFF